MNLSDNKVKVKIMQYGYEIYPVNHETAIYWIAESRAFIKKGMKDEAQKSVYGQGKTIEESIRDLEEKEAKWVEMAEYCGLIISEPPKKAASSKSLRRREKLIVFLAFLLSLLFASSSVILDQKMLIGFIASVLFTTVPMEVIKMIKKNYTGTGYSSPLEKYQEYLEVFVNTQKTSK